MQNTFSRTFTLEGSEDKKFYFTPNKSDAPTDYTVHINRSMEMKRFKMKKADGNSWKIEAQEQRLPEWLFSLESQFNTQIEESLGSRKPAAGRK